MARISLRPGHVQPVWAGHPWVFAQAVAEIDGAPAAGDVVSVVDPRGQFLGKGYYSPGSAIPVRILSRDDADLLDAASLGRRIETARDLRRDLLRLPDEQTNGYRLINAEGDRLAGLVVDVVGNVATVQLLTAGMKRREADIFGHIARVTGARSVIEIASERLQRLEGFSAETAVVRGPDVKGLCFRERGFDYEIELELSQKTGYYFDQRDNRALVEGLSAGRRVLDAFCYLGAFAFGAARGGAERVVAIDSSAPAIASAASAAQRNGLTGAIDFVRSDLKKALPEMAQRGDRFDLVVIDPPKLAPTARHLDAGRKAYRRLNANAMRLVEPGGLLLTCSCSGAMKPDDFVRTLAVAARDAHREATLLSTGQQGSDHPVPPAFPEGRYLKSALLLVR